MLVELGAAAYLVEALASPYIIAAATYLIAAAPYLVVVALVFSVASMLLADEVPNDIHVCLEALQNLVESSMFDQRRLLNVIKAQPAPATVIMAYEGAMTYIPAVGPSADEVAWLTRFRELEDLSAAQETRGLVLVESLVENDVPKKPDRHRSTAARRFVAIMAGANEAAPRHLDRAANADPVGWLRGDCRPSLWAAAAKQAPLYV